MFRYKKSKIKFRKLKNVKALLHVQNYKFTYKNCFVPSKREIF